MTTIPRYTFEECTNLQSITIPTSVTEIEYQAFYKCGIESINIPNSVTNIGLYAFESSGLTSVVIPNSVTSCNNSFESCRKLTRVTIPSSLTSLDYTFRYCNALDDITVLATTPPSIMSTTFSNYNNATLHVLPGCSEAYKAARNWKNFKNIVEDASSGIEPPTIAVSEGEIVYYDLQGHQVLYPYKGVYIINGRKVVVK